MPPLNEGRRDRLADAAMLILAREGARGLTHRAVDAEAGEPPGTTSRYFRTRRALLTAVMEHARSLHFPDLSAAAAVPPSEVDVVERLAAIVQAALTANRTRHLAMAELFLESTRRPELREGLAATRAAQSQLLGDVCRAAGTPLTRREQASLTALMTGLVFIGMTTPQPLRLDDPAEIRSLLRLALRRTPAVDPAA
jgi:DNA-binding transcriptional regulator YbjK